MTEPQPERALTLEQAAAKLEREFTDALRELGQEGEVRVSQRVVLSDRLDYHGMVKSREFLALTRSLTDRELAVVVAVLENLLDYSSSLRASHAQLVHQIITYLTSAETFQEFRENHGVQRHEPR